MTFTTWRWNIFKSAGAVLERWFHT